MQIAYFLLHIAVTMMPGTLPGGEITASRDPRYLLDQAIGRVERTHESVDDSQYYLLLLLSRDVACFDTAASARLLAGAFSIALSTPEQRERLHRLEMLASYASLVDHSLSANASRIVADSGNHEDHPCRELKFLAIELILAHWQNSSEKAQIMFRVERFCEEHERVYQSDIICDSVRAFAEYVSLLDPQLGADIWVRLRPDQAWDQRFWTAEDLVHYAPRTASVELQDLLKSAPNAVSQSKTAVALYCAGERELALAALADMNPVLGRGQPVGDLLYKTALTDPNSAMKIVQSMKPEMHAPGMSIVFEAIAVTRPGQIERFLSDMSSEYQRASNLVLAVRSLVANDDVESAVRLAWKIIVAELRSVALAVVAESSKNRGMMSEAIQLAWKEDTYGRSLRSITACAIRAFGIDDFKQMLPEVMPASQSSWKDVRLCAVLNVAAECDPAWALDIFRRYSNPAPIPEATIFSLYHLELLPKLTSADPEFMLGYLQEHAREWSTSTQKSVKRECMESLARESVANAVQFGQKLGLSESDVDRAHLEVVYRSWQIAKAPARVEQTLEQLSLHGTTSRRYYSLRAVEVMIGWQDDHFRDVEGVIQLAAVLTDKSLADEVLASGASRLHQLGADTEAFRLLNGIGSPWWQAKILESMAYRELFPRPKERTCFLQGCWADEAQTISPVQRRSLATE